MRFTEREMTEGLTGAAKLVAARGKADKKDEVWDGLTRFQRYQLLDSLGTQVLATLVALPDVDVEIGTRPTFTDAQVTEAVEGTLGDVGRLKRKMQLAARVALVKTVLEHVPPRQDPDALIIPDHL
ncbi:hypothetical protein [Nocardioides lianchengensis]|uniref:Uncharacterized protein n=1 Tax=Nocardioides lianchengensis TaxID=1045774 RepID=A0A1G6PPV2_9ACTN|nr:hypothetical protein [Nocardioides lianchengensis]NYG11938.1 hypothetical protein [Nocardioides lianchengensis]SDC82250.1 hypothetical protein SAMN05421872_104106 [Nocardioides lianchengensis]